jgi:hypothetical protein
MYLLTQRGIEQKAGMTLEFIRRKTREYETLRAEAEQMRREPQTSETTSVQR